MVELLTIPQLWRMVAAMVAVALALAGCTDAGPTAAKDDAPTAIAFGSIRGLVVDATIAPLPQVEVTLDESEKITTTDQDGLFIFEDVPAGAHRLRTAPVGFLPALAETEVIAGEETPIVRMVVTAEGTTAGYAQTMKWEGIIQCSTSVAGDGGNCAPAVFGDEFSETYQFDGRPDFVQSELVWEPTQPTLAEQMSIEYWCNRGPPCPDDSLLILGTVGMSPQVLAMERGLINSWEVGDPDQILYIRVDGRSSNELDPEIMLSQPFTVFTTVFYNTAPPQGWTFVNDGAPPV